MVDKSVTRMSGWTEPNSGAVCDERAYRERLAQNADAMHKKIEEALAFEEETR